MTNLNDETKDSTNAGDEEEKPAPVVEVINNDELSLTNNTGKRHRSIANATNTSNTAKREKKMQKRAPFPHTTFEMINDCDRELAEWTADGEMFVIKDPEQFSKTVIPEYFDHSKFESFTRQLNFYGFNKVESKVTRIKDIDQRTVNHVTFYNEFFKRGRKDLLNTIQRSTNRGKSQTTHIEALEAKLNELARELRHAQLQLEVMGNLEKRVVALELKLGQQNQFELNLRTSGECKTVQDSQNTCMTLPQSSTCGTHTPPNVNGTKTQFSSDLMQYSDKQQSVLCGDSPEPLVTDCNTHGHKTPHTIISSEEVSALRLLSEISHERKSEESLNESRIKPHNSEIDQREYSIPHQSASRTCAEPEFSLQYGSRTENIDSNPIFDENENNRVTVPITDEISLNALQSGISQFWQTLVNQRNDT